MILFIFVSFSSSSFLTPHWPLHQSGIHLHNAQSSKGVFEEVGVEESTGKREVKNKKGRNWMVSPLSAKWHLPTWLLTIDILNGKMLEQDNERENRWKSSWKQGRQRKRIVRKSELRSSWQQKKETTKFSFLFPEACTYILIFRSFFFSLSYVPKQFGG